MGICVASVRRYSIASRGNAEGALASQSWNWPKTRASRALCGCRMGGFRQEDLGGVLAGQRLEVLR